MTIYEFSVELESAVVELLEDTGFLLSELSRDSSAFVKALRYLKATRPSVFQIAAPVPGAIILETK